MSLKQLFLDLKERTLSIFDIALTIGLPVSGVNDITVMGAWNGYSTTKVDEVFQISITAGSPDLFTWDDGSGNGAVDVEITGTPQYLANGVFIKFDNITGHAGTEFIFLTYAATPVILFCQMWNNQLELEREGRMYDYPKPAVFFEFRDLDDIQQLGGGQQIYNNMAVIAHIIHRQDNATDDDSLLEQNLPALDLPIRVLKRLNGFQPSLAAEMVRFSEGTDDNHDNLYHFLQAYRTNLIDNTANKPVDGLDYLLDDVTVEITTTFDPSPFTKPLP